MMAIHLRVVLLLLGLALASHCVAQSSVGILGTVQVSSRWDISYAPGDPACLSTPDGLVFNLVGVVPPTGGTNPSFNFFVPRTHRDYDAIVAMTIAAKISGQSFYVIPDKNAPLVCGMPVVATAAMSP